MEFSGERVVPGKTPYWVYLEHINRYIFAASLIQNKAVLDVACGTGYGLDYLVKRGARKAVGVDMSIEAINYAQDRFGGDNKVSFVCADGIRLPCVDNVFDIVISFETIEHIRQYRRFLFECSRVLRKNGLFICSTPNRRVFSPSVDKPPNPFHVKEFWPEEFYRLLCRYFVDITLYGQRDVNLVEKSADQNCEVYSFKNSEIIQSAYIIAVARKQDKERSLCPSRKSQLSS
jgi:ubiquinone/menaquinone biosynthesis C-methylase UbiE